MTPPYKRKEWYSERSHEQLVEDAMKAFVRIEKLELMIWILGGVVIGAVGLDGWLGTALLDCVEAGHRIAVAVMH